MRQSPKLFTCPKCRHTYLGHDPLPDCPNCGYDYREKEGFRWDLIVYLMVIMALMSFLLVASHYRGYLGDRPAANSHASTQAGSETDGLRGFRSPEPSTFPSPYREPGR